MNKNFLHAKLLYALVFVMFNIIIFLLFGFSNHTSTFWLTYAITINAFNMVAVAIFKLFDTGTNFKNVIWGFSSIHLSYTYLAAQTVIAFVFMFNESFSYKICLIPQLILFTLFVIGVVSAYSASEHSIKDQEKTKKDISNMKELLVDILDISNNAADSSLKNNINKLVDKIKYSDPVSSDETLALENTIKNKISKLKANLNEKDAAIVLCEEISNLIDNRNMICKMNK